MAETDWEKYALGVANEVRRSSLTKDEYVEGLTAVIETLQARAEEAETEAFESNVDDDDGEEPDFTDDEGELDFG